MAERDLIDQFLLASSLEGWRFARNNSGLAHFPDGRVVRYGLFAPGGSDCIGFIPRLVREDDVGRTLAIFAAAEMKTGRQKLTAEQFRFQQIVQQAGGIATWGRTVDDIMRKLKDLPTR